MTNASRTSLEGDFSKARFMSIVRGGLVASSLVCGLLLSIWIFAPLLLERTIRALLAERGVQFTIESISVNPFTAELIAKMGRIIAQDQTLLQFDDLSIKVHLWPLIERKIVVSAIDLEGLQLTATHEERGWHVAGLPVTDFATVLPARLQQLEAADKESATSWQLSLPSIELHDTNISLNHLAPVGAVHLSAVQTRIRIPALIIKDVVGQGNNWKGSGTLVLQFDGADIILHTRVQIANGKFVQWMDISPLEADLQRLAPYLPPELQDSKAKLKLAGEVVINGDHGDLRVIATTRVLELSELDLRLDDLAITSALTTGHVERLYFSTKYDASPKFMLKGTFQSRKTQIQETTGQAILAAWDLLNMESLDLSLDEAVKLSIGQIAANAVTLSQAAPNGERLPPLLVANRLLVQGIGSTNTATHVGSVELHDIESEIHLDKDHHVTTLAQGDAVDEESTEHSVSRPTPEVSRILSGQAIYDDLIAPHTITIDHIKVSGDSRVRLVDEGVRPIFKQDIVITSMKLDGLNTGSSNQPWSLLLNAKSDPYSRISSEIRIWPKAKRLTLDARANMHEVDLPSFSPYVAKVLGYEIFNGQMDMQLAMNVDNGTISGESNMVLRALDLEAASAEVGIAQDTQVISLNAAISLLKDRNGNVALNVPLYGDIDNPSFGWSGFVALIAKKAVAEAVSSYLIRAFIPYANLVSIISFAGDRLLKIHVDPPEYNATQIELGSKQKGVVIQLQKLLHDDKELYVKACPIATPQDLALSTKDIALTPQQTERLKAIARRRGALFKETLLQDTDISSSRIFLCAPTVDGTQGARPRIEFDIW